MSSIPEKVYSWIEDNAIVEVRNFNRMPVYVKYTIGHIHENGVCQKNRYGPKCGVDNDYGVW